LLSRAAERMNKSELTVTNSRAWRGVIFPDGISRTAVRGLSESKYMSAHRLKPMAALRAKTMHARTSRKVFSEKPYPGRVAPIK